MLKFSGAALLAGITAGYIYFDDPLYGLIISVCIMFAYPIYREGAERKLRQELLLEFRDLLYSLSASFSLGRNMKQALEESLVFWGNTYSEKDIIVKEISEMIREMEETKVQDVKVLRDFADWYVKCPDWVTAHGMRLLANPLPGDTPVISGESGAVTTGLLHMLMTDASCRELRDALGLNKESVVLLFSTEGDTDPVSYQSIIRGEM